MFAFVLRKLGILLISLWCVVTGTFFLMHTIPGDPFIGEQSVPPEILQSLHAYYGLDQSIWIQYFKYIEQLLQGHLGTSLIYQGRNVQQFILEGFPISALLGLQALCIAIPCGIFLGSLAACKHNRWQDTCTMLFSTVGISIPNFVLATFLQYVLCTKFHLFPIARFGSFEHTILPSLALATLPTAFIARLIRTNMITILKQDYIRTALSKGIPLFWVAMRHGLRNALLPTITYLAPLAAHIMTGSFMIERIFAIPGLGQWMIHSIQTRDYPMIAGLTIFFSAFLMVTMFITDLLYVLVDPRIRIRKVGNSYAA
jgi:oligopeptide transport system permease protein